MKYINVVGTSASGKSTFSKQLARKLKLTYIELDDLFWLDDWLESTDENFFLKLQQKIDIATAGWVIDGNYTRTTAIKWKQVDAIIWLDLPFHLNFLQSVQRAFSRVLGQTQLWPSSNNRENFARALGRDSIVWWMIKTHRKNRKKYLSMMRAPELQHIKFIQLKSRQQIQDYLQQFD